MPRSVCFVLLSLCAVGSPRRVYVILEQSILGSTYSVIINVGSHPVVFNKSFSQPIYAVKLIHTRSPVISELSRVLSYIVLPVTRENLLCPTFDRDVPMHLNGELDHPCHNIAPVVTLRRFSVFEYLEQFQIRFDVGCFGQNAD